MQNYRALLYECRVILSVYRALLSVYRALLSVYRSLLSVYKALLSVSFGYHANQQSLAALTRSFAQIHGAVAEI